MLHAIFLVVVVGVVVFEGGVVSLISVDRYEWCLLASSPHF